MKRCLSFLAAGSTVALLSACSAQTELAVDLRTDLVPAVEFDEVRLTVDGVGGDVSRTVPVNIARDFTRAARIAELRPIEPGLWMLRAELRKNGAVVTTRDVAVRLSRSQVVVVVVTRNCRGVACTPGSTCFSAQCVDPMCSTTDGGTCGMTPACRLDSDCPARPGCVRPRCVQGACLTFPDESLCSAMDYCEPDTGACRAIPPELMLADLGVPARSDMGLDAQGQPDSGPQPDLGVPRVDAGPLPDGGPGDPCAGGCDDGVACTTDTCTPTGCTHTLDDTTCNDNNACTTDRCGATGCTNTATAGGCDDGVYCNGLDTCAAGACTAHAGNPCVGASVCNESADRCMGCATAADCPSTQTGAWDACSGFSSACDTTGTQSRSVTTYACMAGTCMPTPMMQTQACSRSTDGQMCSGNTVGGWGACGGFSGACGTSGTQSRTVTSYTCGGGSCNPSMTNETQGCSRVTDGMTCSATTMGAWSACGGFTGACGTTGTQSRTTTTFSCSAGACAAAPMTEMQGCSRVTDGMSCGTTVTGAWSACGGFTNDCDLSGTQSRSITTFTCTGGACGSSGSSEMQGCTRITEGDPCSRPGVCGQATCSGGVCSGGGCGPGQECRCGECVCIGCQCV